jgi:hypothetical protein
MLATKVICPHCSKHLKTSKPLTVGHRVLCSRCGRSFAIRPDDANGTEAKAEKNGAHPAPRQRSETSPLLEKRHDPEPMASDVETVPDVDLAATPPGVTRNAVLVGIVLGGLLVALLATVVLVVYFARKTDPPLATADNPSESTPPDLSSTPQPGTQLPAGLTPPPERRGSEVPPPLDPPPAGVASEAQPSWLAPEEQEKVNQAIDKGVQYLKKTQAVRGTWAPGAPHHVGYAALPGLTLLECGVPADDIRVQKAARHVRTATPKMLQTYELALSILFLDRLGEPADEKLIETLALRLVAGQTATGGWTYGCPILSEEDERELVRVCKKLRPRSPLDLFTRGPGGSAPPGFFTEDHRAGRLDKGIQGGSPRSTPASGGSTLPLEKDRPGIGGPGSTMSLDRKPIDPKEFRNEVDSLPPLLRKLPSLQPPEKAHDLPKHDGTDNSNTQFAILGLWVASRHNLPVERSLALIVQRFQKSQSREGGWNYHFSDPGQGFTPAMTGAGLLGLAVGHGLKSATTDRPPPEGERVRDPAIEKGLDVLGHFIGKPLGWKRPRARNRTAINMYFMWSVERVGMLYNRRTIAGQDWYNWGAELLLDNQNDDGSWAAGGYPGSSPVIDTCFALLFLKRANLAKDLTKKLEFFTEQKKLGGS